MTVVRLPFICGSCIRETGGSGLSGAEAERVLTLLAASELKACSYSPAYLGRGTLQGLGSLIFCTPTGTEAVNRTDADFRSLRKKFQCSPLVRLSSFYCVTPLVLNLSVSTPFCFAGKLSAL